MSITGNLAVSNSATINALVVSSTTSLLGSLTASAGALFSKASIVAGGNAVSVSASAIGAGGTVLAVSTTLGSGTGYKLITVRNTSASNALYCQNYYSSHI